MIDKVVLHGATYTSLVQRCLSDGEECDALLLGHLRTARTVSKDDESESITRDTLEAFVTTVLVLPGTQCFYGDTGSYLTNVLHKAPPECVHGRHILGWAPLRRRARGDALSGLDRAVVTEFLALRGRMHPGLVSKVTHARMRAPADPENAPFLVAQVAVTRPQALLQADVVCCEAALVPRAAALVGAAWQNPLDLRRRPVEVRNIKALGEGHKHYGHFQPDLGAQLTFLSPQDMQAMAQLWDAQEERAERTYRAALTQLQADQLALSKVEADVEALRRAVDEAEAPQRHRNGANGN